MSTKAQITSELLHAIQNNEFILYYQPEFNLATSQFEGVEALIRWQHPTRGLLLPIDFIHIAEESEIIVTIGEWVLKTACQQNKSWQDKGIPPIRVAVNVAGRQLQPHFVETVISTLKEANLDAKYLELELNENIIIHENEARLIETIKQLKNLGIQVALDDYGTGYTSISYLKKIPVDKIKIDKSFIENINSNHVDVAIVKAIVDLAASLNIQVIAEGVESLVQLKALVSHEDIKLQGFYFSEPLPALEVEKFLVNYLNSKNK